MRTSPLNSGRALVGSALTRKRVAVASPGPPFEEAQKQSSGSNCGCSHSTVAASLPALATTTIMTDEKTAYVPQVEVSKYGEQLAAKTDRLTALLREFSPLPEIEVCVQHHFQIQSQFLKLVHMYVFDERSAVYRYSQGQQSTTGAELNSQSGMRAQKRTMLCMNSNQGRKGPREFQSSSIPWLVS